MDVIKTRLKMIQLSKNDRFSCQWKVYRGKQWGAVGPRHSVGSALLLLHLKRLTWLDQERQGGRRAGVGQVP